MAAARTTENTTPLLLYHCYVRICCCENVFTEPLPRNRSGILGFHKGRGISRSVKLLLAFQECFCSLKWVTELCMCNRRHVRPSKYRVCEFESSLVHECTPDEVLALVKKWKCSYIECQHSPHCSRRQIDLIISNHVPTMTERWGDCSNNEWLGTTQSRITINRRYSSETFYTVFFLDITYDTPPPR
jgi:hypothetical protein